METDLKELKNDLNKLRRKHIRKYDATKKLFNVGDKAWIFYNFQPIQVEIVEIQDFNTKESTGAYIFYWIHFNEISKLEEIWEKIKFNTWLYFLRFLKIRQPKISPKFGPGHAVLPGRHEDLFYTKEEALAEGYFSNFIFDVEDLIYEKENSG